MNDSLKKEIIKWNNLYPIDRWWRQKHNVAFNSPEHREISFLDQLFEFKEEQLFEKHEQSKEYIPNSGDWLAKQERSEAERLMSIQEEAKKEFENLPDEF